MYRVICRDFFARYTRKLSENDTHGFRFKMSMIGNFIDDQVGSKDGSKGVKETLHPNDCRLQSTRLSLAHSYVYVKTLFCHIRTYLHVYVIHSHGLTSTPYIFFHACTQSRHNHRFLHSKTMNRYDYNKINPIFVLLLLPKL